MQLCAYCGDAARRCQGSVKRFYIQALPSGYLSARRVGACGRGGYYKAYRHLITINRPITPALVDAAFRWAVKTYGL